MATYAGYGEFKRGWPVVLSSMLGIGLGLAPLPFYTVGVFAPLLMAAFSWKMSEILTSLLITTAMIAWAGPLAGLLAVRWGVRRVALGSTALFGFSFMSLAFSNGSLPLFYVTWAVIAIAGAGTLPITWTRAVNHRFDRRKGLALGISLMGTGLFGILGKPYLAWAIGAFSWRGAYVALGALPLLIALPVGYFLFRDNDVPSEIGAPQIQTQTSGLSVAETLHDWRFWLIALAILPISFALAGPVPNLELILRTSGIAPVTILELTPLVGLASLLGRLAGGWLLDRFWAPAVGFAILGLPTLSCLILTADHLTYFKAASSILLIGFALGLEYDLIAFLVARYFGLRSYTAIYGMLYVSFALGAGMSPLIFGYDFDVHGNYHFMLTLSALLLVGGAAALLLLGRYRNFDATE